MKKVGSFFRYIFTIILAISLILLFLINLLSKTIFDKEFILKINDEVGYYDKVYEYLVADFEQYLTQNGLDTSILEEAINKEDIVNDAKKLLNNINENREEIINAENIKTSLSAKINVKAQEVQITEEQKNAYNEFIEKAQNDYLNTVAYSDYEKVLYNEYHKLDFVLDITQKLVLIFLGVAIFGVMVASGRRIHKFFTSIGLSFSVTGLFFIILNIFTHNKININEIDFLNDATSSVLKKGLETILGQALNMGLIMMFGGLALVIVSNLIHKYFKNRHENYNEMDKHKKPKLLAEKNPRNDKENIETKEENSEIEKEEKKSEKNEKIDKIT